MKKSSRQNTRTSKLSLSRETVRELTDRDLALVAAGACEHASIGTQAGTLTVTQTC